MGYEPRLCFEAGEWGTTCAGFGAFRIEQSFGNRLEGILFTEIGWENQGFVAPLPCQVLSRASAANAKGIAVLRRLARWPDYNLDRASLSPLRGILSKTQYL